MCSCSALGFKQSSYRKAEGVAASSKQCRDLARCCFATFTATRSPPLSAPGRVSPCVQPAGRCCPSLSHRLSVRGSSVSQEPGRAWEERQPQCHQRHTGKTPGAKNKAQSTALANSKISTLIPLALSQTRHDLPTASRTFSHTSVRPRLNISRPWLPSRGSG